MTRPGTADDPDDPMAFVRDYAFRHDLPVNPGDTAAERLCTARADAAREEYKARRNAAAASTSADPNHPATTLGMSDDASALLLDRKGLSPAQKYNIRLRNNRKSAHAAKVHAEVLKRELSKFLQHVQLPNNKSQSEDKSSKQQPAPDKQQDAHPKFLPRREDSSKEIRLLNDRLRTLSDKFCDERRSLQSEIHQVSVERDALKEQCSSLSTRLQEAQKCEQHLQKRITQLMQHNRLQPTPQPQPPTSLPRQNALTQTQRYRPSVTPLESDPPSPRRTDSLPGSDPAPSSVPASSQDAATPVRTPTKQQRSPQPDTYVPRNARRPSSNKPAVYSTLHARLVSAQGFAHPPDGQDDDDGGKELNTGLTYSQSHEEGRRPVKFGVIGSQNSGFDNNAFKSSLGSEDMNLTDAPDFALASQGSTANAANTTTGEPSPKRQRMS